MGLTLLLAGCAGFGVAETSNPFTKLSDAHHLTYVQGRPLIAERLIHEALEICEKTSDQRCFLQAYLTYGLFFSSWSIGEKWDKHYRENGFWDRSARFDTRYEKSAEYLEKARAIAVRLERFDSLSNINMNLGNTYEQLGEVDAACRAYDESIANSQENLRRNPGVKVTLPPGINSFAEYVDNYRKRAGCNARGSS